MNEESLRQARILMIDDEVGNLCLLENVLNRLGFTQLRTLSEPRSAYHEFMQFNPDLVICDLIMPGFDGFQIIEQLRSQLPRDSCLPILVLTGNPTQHNKRRALAVGATDILLKPFDSSEILMRIRNLLRTRFLHLEIQEQNQHLENKVAERTQELQKALAELKQSQHQMVQQERFRAFGEMAGGVVHDFNNALMTIIGYSELLLQDEESLADQAIVREYLQTMNTAGRDASHVVSQLRDFYRPREETDVFSAINLSKLLEEVVSLTQPKWKYQALARGQTVTISLELEKVPLILGNPAELREVATNLIFNAVDAMPDGGTITLRSRQDGGEIVVEVSDTGSGMTEEVRQRCLEPFFSTKGERGTGLGLSMVFGIIKRHDGTLDLESERGRGTTFRIRLPVQGSEDLAAPETSTSLGRSLHVLVVDDEPLALDVVAKYLMSDGHRVSTAVNGAEALEKLTTEEFDLLLTDHAMAGMSGVQLAEALREIGGLQPVILLTGSTFAIKEKPAWVDLILKKPIPPERLRRAIFEVMQAPAVDMESGVAALGQPA
ncbi:MAG TPA: response regulator [Chthoniobacteraceae bacterium]